MDDCIDLNESLTTIIAKSKTKRQIDEKKQLFSHPLDLRNREKMLFHESHSTTESLVSRATTTKVPKKIGDVQNIPASRSPIKPSTVSTEPYCHIKLNSVLKLKDSTKKLLCLLEEIQKKTPPERNGMEDGSTNLTDNEIITSVTNICANALRKLENQTSSIRALENDHDDDCSIFKRLTRKCHCLNQQEYNDFIIQFNENTKYCTSNTGEIIKNLRILKKFLYMGGGYCRHALMFLTQGFSNSSYNEKVEISQGCAHADICNVFDDVSIVIACIAWPYKQDSLKDSLTQELAAGFLFELAQFEEGRRYLTFTSKISHDIKKVLKKKGNDLSFNTINSLQAVLNITNPENSLDAVNISIGKLSEGNRQMYTSKTRCSQYSSQYENLHAQRIFGNVYNQPIGVNQMRSKIIPVYTD